MKIHYVCGRISASSWPARTLASEITSRKDLCGPFIPFEPTPHDVQYLNPNQHQQSTGFIADWGGGELQKEVEEAWAVWYSQDGNMNLKQKKNEFHCLI